MLPPEAVVKSLLILMPRAMSESMVLLTRVYIDFHGLCCFQKAMQMSVVWSAAWSHDAVQVCAALKTSHVWTSGSTTASVYTDVYRLCIHQRPMNSHTVC